MRNRILILTPLFLAFACGSLFADTLTLQFTGVDNAAGNYYISPYTVTVQGTGQVLTVYCIDFNHEVWVGDEWTVNQTVLDAADVGNLQYGSAGYTEDQLVTDYSMAAWLITQLTNASTVYEQAVYQYAAWEIFLEPSNQGAYNASVNAVGVPSFSSDIATAFEDAQTAVADGYTPTGWDILTPTIPGLPNSAQEFLVDPPSVPEPSSIVLLATVLGGLALALRKSRRRGA
jgi:hypothetical protein